jgi:hypothetical protein
MIKAIEINKEEIQKLSNLIVDPQTDIPKSIPSNALSPFSTDDICAFCNRKAVYGIVTDELLDFLRQIIGDRSAIEIAAGYGTLGRELKIPLTDKKIQEFPEVKIMYEMMQQPVISYPKDVEKLDALDAIRKYKPKVVVAQWFTARKDVDGKDLSVYGINEDDILNNEHVETYIHIGHSSVHANKAILRHPHIVITAPWLKSRATSKGVPQICIWTRKHIDLKTIESTFIINYV